MNLSQHFTVEELSVTHQLGPDGRVLGNIPVGSALVALAELCRLILEPIRLLWRCPVLISSGYRSESVERAVQLASGLIVPGESLAPSQHLLGQAADIVPASPVLGIEEAYHRIWGSDIPYDQLLLEGVGARRWIHVSVAPVNRVARRQAWTSPDGRSWAVYHPQSTKEQA